MKTRNDWGFLYEMTDLNQHDQHVWDFYFWRNIIPHFYIDERYQ